MDQTPYLDNSGNISLSWKYSDLYNRKNYLTSITLIQNKIYEYDIRAANVTMLKESGRIKQKTLDKLSMLEKRDREIKVGLMIKQDKNLQTIISDGIINAKRKFFKENSIIDNEILSIKNDAVFVIGRRMQHTVFNFVEFKLKNTFSLYINLNKIELYYDMKNDTVIIKGVNDEIVNTKDHQIGMITFFKKVFAFICYDRKNDLRKYLIEFSHLYKNKELPFQYYRELNSFNIYRTIYQFDDFAFNTTIMNDENKSTLNITYNYNRYILPLIQKYI